MRKGRIPSEFFHGAPELERKEHTLRYLEVHDVPGRGLLRYAAELIIRKKNLPVKVHFALLAGVKKLLPELQDADVIMATTSGIAFSLAILKLFRVSNMNLRAELVALHCGVLNYPHNQLRLLGSRLLFKNMWTLLYGIGEKESMMTRFRIPANRIQVNCFGVDETFWTPEKQRDDEGYILSIGNDQYRDYKVFLEAAKDISQKVKLVTIRRLPANIPNNVELIHGYWHTQDLDDQDIRDLYRKAFCVVIPLKDSIQPSGQSVTLQAMACGTPVILTQTPGLWEQTNLHDRKNILFVRQGKPDDIVEAVKLLNRDRSLRQKLCRSGLNYVQQFGRIAQFADRVEALCDHALSYRKK